MIDIIASNAIYKLKYSLKKIAKYIQMRWSVNFVYNFLIVWV